MRQSRHVKARIVCHDGAPTGEALKQACDLPEVGCSQERPAVDAGKTLDKGRNIHPGVHQRAPTVHNRVPVMEQYRQFDHPADAGITMRGLHVDHCIPRAFHAWPSTVPAGPGSDRGDDRAM